MLSARRSRRHHGGRRSTTPIATALVGALVLTGGMLTAFVAGRLSAEPVDSGEARTTAPTATLQSAVPPSTASTSTVAPQSTVARQSTVPPQSTVPGRSDRFRPVLHLTPGEHWMNDPNGPVFLNGRYHLFYQYNPGGNLWGDIAWGHAVSDDLLVWEELDVAISAASPDMIFSGSAVSDSDGLGGRCARASCLVAVYTYHSLDPGSGLVEQTQHIAYSDDDGLTFTPFAGNPVVDFERADFRDPNVFWHAPTARWVMTVALPVDRQIIILTSPDLMTWEVASEFGPAGAIDGIWECPVLLELPVGETGETAWVLKVDHGAGHVSGGSGGQYFIGDFDGRTFTSREPEGPIRWVDWGSDFYCAMQFSGLPDPVRDATWIAWMSNWDYASATPTHPWRGAMTLPRTIRLDDATPPVLVQEPPAVLAERRRDERRYTGASVAEIAEAVAADTGGAVLDIELELEVGAARSIELDVAANETSAVTLRYDAVAGTLSLDRSRAAANIGNGFADVDTAPLRLTDGRLDLRLVLDHSSIEVFADGGRVVLTDLVFPSAGAVSLRIRHDGEPTGPVTIAVWNLD